MDFAGRSALFHVHPHNSEDDGEFDVVGESDNAGVQNDANDSKMATELPENDENNSGILDVKFEPVKATKRATVILKETAAKEEKEQV